jgi:cephalosporin hydroxylase
MIDKDRYATALSAPLLASVQRGTLSYTYKGIPTLKNPFDLALYPVLLWEVRPRTIIEIGSNRGGSALWMSDTMRTFSLPCHIHSVDLEEVGLQAPDVTFHRGDARRLSTVLPDALLKDLPRPLLVIEDADHRMETTLAVLRFFDAWLEPGEYLIVEDGIVAAMGEAEAYEGGPHLAIERFLEERAADYAIDTRYCDWFGLNVTWNVNGFLRRVAKAPAAPA